jgi:hypothetical protein
MESVVALLDTLFKLLEWLPGDVHNGHTCYDGVCTFFQLLLLLLLLSITGP